MKSNDLKRYSVNMRLPDFGSEAQFRLLNSRLLIVGSGALGSTAAMYCAGSGVGKIGIVDFDTVDLSNLQRQVFFRENHAGKSKAMTIAENIRLLNSDCEAEAILHPLTNSNAEELISEYDFVIDAADNPATTFLIEDTCVKLDKSYVTAGVAEYHAQLMTHTPGTALFSDIFPRPQRENNSLSDMMPCTGYGVFGPLAGTIACLEASEAIKTLSGCGNPLTDSILRIDLQTNEFSVINL